MNLDSLLDAQLSDLGLIRGVDGRIRPRWAEGNDQLRDYFDYEWGREIRDEQGLLERLCLEGFQAGLSWNLVLQKRDALRDAFHHFQPDEVAGMQPSEITALAQRPELIRNERKLSAAVTNAKATIKLREEVGLSQLLWSFAPVDWQVPETMAQVPTQTPESQAMAKELKRRGFTFVGPVTCFALMQAVGMADCRVPGTAQLLDL
ncbi:DNA-3-methyladenine glycosylase I [Corynebacterium sp.]|uniref:DNA-3-methyladenine glycosylase I n=1 Tax=Corynebacterium sp. TaxID=1720 RepID=UPI0026DD7A7E|nr:DNA-3-methyladenine glycosylase I [Corynebacterium sp.]MDO5077676.1 DNA-3-methyladenine glycosylase I [Corynebacterium sp.]